MLKFTLKWRGLAALAAVCAAAIVFWIRSEYLVPRRSDTVAYEGPRALVQVSSHRAAVHFVVHWWSYARPRPAGWTLDRVYHGGQYGGGWRLRGGGFVLAYLGHARWDYDVTDYPFLAVVLPDWFLVLVAGGLLTGYGLFAARGRARNRRGLCMACGYDLRGSESATCPECGFIADKPAAAEPPSGSS